MKILELKQHAFFCEKLIVKGAIAPEPVWEELFARSKKKFDDKLFREVKAKKEGQINFDPDNIGNFIEWMFNAYS